MSCPGEPGTGALAAEQNILGWQLLKALCSKLQILNELHWARPLDALRTTRADIVAEMTGDLVGLEAHQIYVLLDNGAGTADGLMRQLRAAGASPREERGETALRGASARLPSTGRQESPAKGHEEAGGAGSPLAWRLLRALCRALEGLDDRRMDKAGFPRMYLDVAAEMIGDIVGLEGVQIYELFDWDGRAEGLMQRLVAAGASPREERWR
jgi:hypothetical protein